MRKKAQKRSSMKQVEVAGARYFPHLRVRGYGEFGTEAGMSGEAGLQKRTLLHRCAPAKARLRPQKRMVNKTEIHRSRAAEAAKYPQKRND